MLGKSGRIAAVLKRSETREIVAPVGDRICIHSNGKDQVRISALDLSCCKQCSSKGLCKGGTIDEAFVYWAKTGIVTGGEVRRNQTDL
ncbi:unnamed protein product [Callosobruchus maculatus]|uniref:Peptidase C1A papain C-terminal domain-containing protein n=1 Tax=Callosobruchus maculatus TaxID=64391 RepID=A0A653CH08_CALMS|nr:unnamed protein product [Callosobruchus maculatus]